MTPPRTVATFIAVAAGFVAGLRVAVWGVPAWLVPVLYVAGVTGSYLLGAWAAGQVWDDREARRLWELNRPRQEWEAHLDDRTVNCRCTEQPPCH